MIRVTELNDVELTLNSDLIQQVQETPDTVIVLINGEAFRVQESAAEVRRRVIEFRAEITQTARVMAALNKDVEGRNCNG
jgi:flagellar protein FlbD